MLYRLSSSCAHPLNFLRSVNDDTSIPGYPLLDRISATAQLINFMIRPESQDQWEQNLCGPNSFYISIAKEKPIMYIHMVLSLLSDKARCKFPIELSINQSIAQNCSDIGQLLSQALKNAQPEMKSRISTLFDGYSPNSIFSKDIYEPTTETEMLRFLNNVSDYIKVTLKQEADKGLVKNISDNFFGFIFNRKLSKSPENNVSFKKDLVEELKINIKSNNYFIRYEFNW